MLDIAIIGAGPYGLSIAAHFRSQGISFRIFGRPMDFWLAHMPKGMMLKSDGFASNIYDPNGEFTLERFCAERGIEYGDTGIPVRLETFTAYGLAFQQRFVPELENRLVSGIERLPDGFSLQLDTGETVKARRVVMAIGISHFDYIPGALAHLPPEYLSHSSRHHDLEPLQGRKIAIIGAGSSALDLAGLLHQAGGDVQLISRRAELNFHSKPTGKPRSLWQRIRHPKSGLGPGIRSRFYSNTPQVFHRLPERLRVALVRTSLGPSGGWFARDLVIGRVPLLLGYTPESAEVRDGMVHLHLRAANGGVRDVTAQHVIAATGYEVDMKRLKLLGSNLSSALATVSGSPVLNSRMESSVPGLYFAGVTAAISFGPVMRFAFGAGFAARRITKAVSSSLSEERRTTVRVTQPIAHSN
ncbi:MAG: Ferredoxin--NADP reductase [Bryobacteraceae bacterium]|nr:Ferredoxin--NADP reductase [Bryobacteraceae bacterium]